MFLESALMSNVTGLKESVKDNRSVSLSSAVDSSRSNRLLLGSAENTQPRLLLCPQSNNVLQEDAGRSILMEELRSEKCRSPSSGFHPH